MTHDGQVAARNARRIRRMGGLVAGDNDPRLAQPAEPEIDESRVIRDATGRIIRVL